MAKESFEESFYKDKTEQNKIENYRILLIGANIGSVIAECALRFGFKNITLADNSYVEAYHLKSYNYTQSDIGKLKAECLSARLLKINQKATIRIHTYRIDDSNVKELIRKYDVIINTMDFTDHLLFSLDEECKNLLIPILHLYHVGQTGALIVITPDSMQLKSIFKSAQDFQKEFIEYISRYLRLWEKEIQK